MISAVSPAMTGTSYKYNVNFGQLRPQSQTLKSYNDQIHSKDPSFGRFDKSIIIGICMGAIAGVFVPYAISAASSNWTKWAESSQITQARKICAELPETNNIKCLFSCGMLDKPMFSNKEVAPRILKNCSRETLEALK